ncbi:hypothetical protein Lser_V15G27120 [Lactuca serriola]
MATIGEGSGSSNPNASSSASSHQAPKILLAKPSLVTTAKYNREAGGGGGGGGPDDASSSLRFRFPCLFAMSILLLLKIQRFRGGCVDDLLFMENIFNFMIIGVPELGRVSRLCPLWYFTPKRIYNQLVLNIESLLKGPYFCLHSPSILAEMIRPDGSSIISVLGGEPLPVELAHELMGISSSL